LCVDLFESDYSEEDISEFAMRKFLKNIHNNYSFEIKKMDSPVVEDNIVVEEENTTVEDTIVAENAIHVIDNTVEDNIVIEDNTTVEETIVDNPVVVEDKKTKKASKKSEEENDYDMESYLDHFKSNTDYTNQQRILIFKSEFNSQLSDAKIGKIINQYFKVSSARIGGKKTKLN
jgi:hypothetical protein